MKAMFPDLLRGFLEKSKENTGNQSIADDKKEENSTGGSKKSDLGNPPKTKEKQKCQHCDKEFQNSYLKGEHFSKKHPELLKYPCKFCIKKFQTDSELNWHSLIHQQASGNQENKRIRYILPKPSNQVERSSSSSTSPNSPNTPVSKPSKILERTMCDLCNKIVTKKRLQSHKMVYHFKNGQFPCSRCSKRFLNKRDLKRHLPIHDEGLIWAKSKKEPCDICGKVLTKVRLETHKLRFHHNGEYMCKNCQKKFPHIVDLDWHLSHDCKPNGNDNVAVR